MFETTHGERVAVTNALLVEAGKRSRTIDQIGSKSGSSNSLREVTRAFHHIRGQAASKKAMMHSQVCLVEHDCLHRIQRERGPVLCLKVCTESAWRGDDQLHAVLCALALRAPLVLSRDNSRAEAHSSAG